MLISTVGEGYAADHRQRLMEQGGHCALSVSVGGVLLKSRDECARAAVARRDSEADRPGKRGAGDCGYQRHGISTSGSYRNYYELDGKRVRNRYRSANGRPIEHNPVMVTVIAPTALESGRPGTPA